MLCPFAAVAQAEGGTWEKKAVKKDPVSAQGFFGFQTLTHLLHGPLLPSKLICVID